MNRIILPLPPSTNHITTVSNGRKINSEDYQRWIRWATTLANRYWPCPPLTGPISLIISAYFWDGAKADLSNRLKPTEDLLTGIAYKDDKQVVEIHLYKGVATTNDIEDLERGPRVEIIVEEIA